MRSELEKGEKTGHVDFRAIGVVVMIIFLAVAGVWGGGGCGQGQRLYGMQRNTAENQGLKTVGITQPVRIKERTNRGRKKGMQAA